jgi:hypothetical protein
MHGSGLGEGLTSGLGEGLTSGLGEGLTSGLGDGLTSGLGEGLSSGLGEGLGLGPQAQLCNTQLACCSARAGKHLPSPPALLTKS